MHNIVAILEVPEPDSGTHSQILHYKASIIQNAYCVPSQNCFKRNL